MTAALITTTLAALVLGCTEEKAPPVNLPDSFTVRLESGWTEVGFGPLDGATVALDDGAGRRTEGVSGPDGEVTFAVDWTDGPVDITVDPGLSGAPLFTAMERNLLDDGMTVRFQDPSVLDDRVTIYGWITPADGLLAAPVADASDLLPPRMEPETYVNAHGAAGGEIQTGADVYAIQVVPGTDFDLMAVQVDLALDLRERDAFHTYTNWSLYRVAGIDEDTRFDLTLGDGIGVGGFEASFALPADRLDPLRADDVASTARVLATVDGHLANACGFPSWMERSADGTRFDMAGKYVAPGFVDAAVTELKAYSTSSGVGSVAYVAGTPDTWRVQPQLLPVPELTDGHRNGAGSWTMSISDPGVDGVRSFVQIYGANEQLLWEAVGPEGLTLDLPAPPSSVDAVALGRAAERLVPYLVRELGLELTHYAYGEPQTLAQWTMDEARDVLPEGLRAPTWQAAAGQGPTVSYYHW